MLSIVCIQVLELAVSSAVLWLAMPETLAWKDSCSLLPSWDLPCLRPWGSSVWWWPSCCCLLSKLASRRRQRRVCRLLALCSTDSSQLCTHYSQLWWWDRGEAGFKSAPSVCPCVHVLACNFHVTMMMKNTVWGSHFIIHSYNVEPQAGL